MKKLWSTIGLLALTSIALNACSSTPAPTQAITLSGVATQASTQGFQLLGYRVNGQSSDANEPVRNGSIVEVRGKRSDDGRVTPDAVTVNVEVKGAVSSINAANKTLVVLGQTVQVTADTVFEGSDDTILSFADLQIGMFIEVSGLRQDDGTLVATRIEREKNPPASNSVRLCGTISSLDATAKTFKVEGLTVDYSSATVKGTPADGMRVKVRGSINASGVLVASQLEVKKPSDDDDDDHDDGRHELEGISSNLDTTAKTVVVRGVTVDYSSAIVEGTPATDV
ncbi:MAG: DUF5666 domain-containing protein, partial [Casimicrobium sp.]